MQGFTKANNTFSRQKGTEKRRIGIEVGDSKKPDFLPQFKTSHWDNEANLSIRYKDNDGENSYQGAQVRELPNQVEWEKNGVIARMYEKDTGDEDGGFEFEVEFASKPATNEVTFSIRAKEFDFFYQDFLTPEEIAEGAVRPDNIVGSYAVYHKTKKNNFVDGKEYRTGKAFHIYRPWAEDANGVRVWCELNIDEQTQEMKVTVPQDFLDNAVYPVIVDPTFGYTTIGGTTGSANTPGAFKFTTPTGAGDLQSITVRTNKTATDYNLAAALYSEGSNAPNSLLTSHTAVVAITSTSPAWYTVNVTSYDIADNTTYWLARWMSQSSNYYYDVGAVAQYQTRASGEVFSTWQNPFSPTNTFDRVGSIYGTFTDPPVPVMTTTAATNIDLNQVDLNGSIDDLQGAGNATIRGFEYEEETGITTDNESFETNLGIWVNDPANVSDWIRDSGGTTSTSTGPTTGSVGSFYIYIETSSGSSFTAGDTDIIEANCVGGAMSFDVHQYGINQGTLHVEWFNGSIWQSLWSSTGDQGNVWNSVNLTIPAGASKVRFRNVAAGSFRGDVALDNITIPSGKTYGTTQTINESGSYGVGSYSLTPTGLTQNTTYRCRAYATNPEGTGYGDYVDFTTASPPGNGNMLAFFLSLCAMLIG